MKKTLAIVLIVVALSLVASGAWAMSGATPVADSAKGLSDKQRGNARIIESELRAAGFGSKVVAAAIANAKAESGLSNGPPDGDGGHSVGLFQLNDINGAGVGLTKEFRRDPVNNVRTIIKKELQAATSWGQKFRAVANSPTATVGDITEAWCKFVERPKNAEADSKKRRDIAAAMWPGGNLA